MLRLALVVALVVTAAVAANVALLSLSSGAREPVGKLMPVAAQEETGAIPSPPIPPPPQRAHEGEEEDD